MFDKSRFIFLTEKKAIVSFRLPRTNMSLTTTINQTFVIFVFKIYIYYRILAESKTRKYVRIASIHFQYNLWLPNA